jgi:hypothetical protein
MRVIINSSVVADGVADLQVDCYKNGVLLCTESLLKATLLEQQLVSHHISYTRFGGENGKQFEINCKSISAYSTKV